MRALVGIGVVGLAVGIAHGAVPGEVPPDAVFASDRVTLTWSAVPGATGYDVYAGTSPAASDHACRVYATPATSAVLAEEPSSPGGLLYFLIAARNTEGVGTLGSASDGTPRPNPAPCSDVDGDAVPDNVDTCPLVADPGQHDQDGNGVGDRCDPHTYDFEADPVGAAPAGLVRLGPVGQVMTVKDLGGDRAVSYDGAGVGAHERFERLLAGMPHQDTTVWIDVEETAEVGSIELWSEGAWGWNAGGGVILQLTAAGGITMYDRDGQSVPSQPGPAIPAGGRMRLRLEKGPGTTSTLHVDAWDGQAFAPDHAVFPIADDHRYRGLGTVLADYFGGPRAFRRVTIVHGVPAASLTIRKDPSWSTDWKVFQRDATDRATIPVRLYVRLAEAGRLQARVVDAGTGSALPGHDWGDHELPLAPADGASAELVLAAVPAGGNYDVEVRLLRDADGALLGQGRIDEVAVGDVFLAAGQSNMSGYSGSLVGAETPIDEVHLFGNDYRWKRASEPMDDGTDQVDKVSGEAPAHSLMLSFARNVHAATGVPVGIVPGPLGGTNLHTQWQRNAADHDDRGTLYGSMLHRARVQGFAVPPRGMLWFQGESDAGRGTALYRADLERLIAQYREDLGSPDLPFLLAQLGTYDFADLPTWLPIQEAQRQVVEADPRTALVPTVDEPRADVIHFSVAGYRSIGVRFGEAARELIHGEPLDASLRLVAARVAGTGRSIELEYDGAVTGGAPTLFRVTDDGQAVAVSEVTTSGNVVTLKVGSRLSGTILATYGWSRTPAVAWVKDARGTPVPAFHDVPVAP